MSRARRELVRSSYEARGLRSWLRGEALEKMRADLTRDNPVTAPLLRRFAHGHKAMEPASADDCEGYYRLLTGVVLGWEID